MSLATLRAHVWKGGADVMLYYKSNGRRTIKYEKVGKEGGETEQDSGVVGMGVGGAGTTGAGVAAPVTGGGGGSTSFVGP